MKIRMKVTALVAGIVLALTACQWASFRYGPENTGFNPNETTISAANVGSLSVRWTADLASEVFSTPVVAGGKVYGLSVQGSLQVFDAAGATGCSGTPAVCTPLWRATLGGSASSAPAVANGVVYAGSTFTIPSPFSMDGTLSAFDAAGSTNCSGSPVVCSPLWTADTGTGMFSAPTVANGTVYIDSGGLQAYDAAGTTGCSGVPKTCVPLWLGAPGFSNSSAAVADGVAYLLVAGELEAYDAAGAGSCSSSPVVCSATWVTPPSGSTDSSPAVADGRVIIGLADGTVRAYKTNPTFPQCTGTAPKTCNSLWSRNIGGPVVSSPAIANGVVYIGSPDGKLYALDAANGTVLWTAATGAAISSSPAVANGVVYVGSQDDKLYAFDATGTAGCSGTPKTCTPLFTHITGGDIISSPVVANGQVFVGSADHKLYAFGL